jgi:RHS repeat-associated protein
MENGNAALKLENREGFYPFGMRLAYQYTRQEYDSELDLHNFRARFYDSDLMHFYAVDPLEEFSSSYLFCGNNPIIYIDPSGTFSKKAAFQSFSYGVATVALFSAGTAGFFYSSGLSLTASAAAYQMAAGTFALCLAYGIAAIYDRNFDNFVITATEAITKNHIENEVIRISINNGVKGGVVVYDLMQGNAMGFMDAFVDSGAAQFLYEKFQGDATLIIEAMEKGGSIDVTYGLMDKDSKIDEEQDLPINETNGGQNGIEKNNDSTDYDRE